MLGESDKLQMPDSSEINGGRTPFFTVNNHLKLKTTTIEYLGGLVDYSPRKQHQSTGHDCF